MQLQKTNLFDHLKLKFLFLPAFFLSFALHSNAQDQSKPDYSKEPSWIKMMDDKNVNYYEALNAYETYWKSHKKLPGEEEEMSHGKRDFKEMQKESEREQKKDQKKKFTEEDLKKANDEQEMKYQVKRFEQWMREVKPFVQEDGRILSDDERINLWKKQQEEIKKLQK